MTLPRRYELHVTRPDLTSALVARETALASALLTANVSGVADLQELEQILLRTYAIPFPARSFDSIVDLAVDIPAWMPAAPGWILKLTGLDSCSNDVCTMAVQILPPILDRWRSAAGHSFVVALESTSRRARVLDLLSVGNRRLRESGERPGTVTFIGPVPVYVDGVLDEAASAGVRPPS